MKLSDFNILYLNLKRRPDRLFNIEKQLIEKNIPATLISAIDGQSLTNTEKEKHLNNFYTHRFAKREDRILGRIGCRLSHLKLLEYAIKKKWSNVLILEDDCQFMDDAEKIDINPPQDTDIFYLGGFYWHRNPEPHLQKSNWININNKYFKIACTFAYGIIGLDKIKDIYHIITHNKPEAIDLMYIKYIQKKGHCYIINPSICFQNTGFKSDVTYLGGSYKPEVKKITSYFYHPSV